MAGKATAKKAAATGVDVSTETVEQVVVWAAAAGIVLAAVFGARMQTDTSAPANFVILLGALLPLSWLLITGKESLERIPLFWVSIAALALVGVSVIFTVSPWRTLGRGFDLLSAGAVFLAATSMRRCEKRAVVLLGAVAAGGAVAAVVGGNEYATHARAGDFGWRVFSTFFNPGFLAGFLVLSIPATIALFLRSRERALTGGLGFLALLQMLGLTLTGARAGILALGAGLVVFAAVLVIGRTMDRTGWSRLAALLVLAAAAGFLVGRPTQARIKGAAGEGHSFGFRVYTWKGTAKMAEARPLTGFGPGTFEMGYYPYSLAGYTRLAHSTYLQTAAESGIPAAALLFVWWFTVAGAAAWKLVRRRVGPSDSLLVAAALAGCAATSARGVFDSDWWCLPILLGAAAMAGIMVSDAPTDRPRKSGALDRAAGWFLAVAALAAAVLLAVVCVSMGRAEQARQAESSGDWSAALSLWRDASLLPWNVTARLRAAQIDAVGGPAEKARAEFARFENLEPTNPKIPRSDAQVLEQTGDRIGALEQLSRARTLDPKSPRLLLDEALCLEALGRKADALVRWREMVRVEKSPYGQVRAIPQMVEPSYAWAHAALGDEDARIAKPSQARQEWTQAREVLRRYFDSLKDMQPVLQAGGLWDAEFDEQAKKLLDRLDTHF